MPSDLCKVLLTSLDGNLYSTLISCAALVACTCQRAKACSASADNPHPLAKQTHTAHIYKQQPSVKRDNSNQVAAQLIKHKAYQLTCNCLQLQLASCKCQKTARPLCKPLDLRRHLQGISKPVISEIQMLTVKNPAKSLMTLRMYWV